MFFLLCVAAVGVAGDARAGEISALEDRVEDREARLEQRLRELDETGAVLKRAQARVEEVGARAAELASQTEALEGQLAQQQDAYVAARREYEARAVAIYKGSGDEGLLLVLERLLGTGEGLASSAGAQAVEVLVGGKEDLDAYADAREELTNIQRQLAQKQEAYGAVRNEVDARQQELEGARGDLEASIEQIRKGKNQAQSRIEELEAAEKERIRRQRAATREAARQRAAADEAAQRQADKEAAEQAEIARDEIVAAPVDLPVETYMKLYKKAASDYGFAGDWYVLAAVGHVESNHGENMGPSTAGAMGPMQFLPSTWKYSGVDGNGDGEANIMDPRDAIPAAANYLRVGGAPDDWSAALYSYNHAEWYVDQVLAVAESYRQADAGGGRTAPYV